MNHLYTVYCIEKIIGFNKKKNQNHYKSNLMNDRATV